MYEDFASVYDRLMNDVDYKSWANYYISLMEKHGNSCKKVLECGCGTGSISKYISKKYELIASDISVEMLAKAKENFDKENLHACFANIDMKKIKLPEKQDAIIACCDAVNYLTTPNSVLRFLKSAYANLNDKGLLCFDVSSEYKLYKLLPSMPWVYDDEDISYIWQNFKERRKLYMELSIFVKEGDTYRKIEENQVQASFSIIEYKKLLRQAGFKEIYVYGDRSYKNPHKNELRIHFVAKKVI